MASVRGVSAMTKIKGTKCDICGRVIGDCYSGMSKVKLKAKGIRSLWLRALYGGGSNFKTRIDLCGECWDKVKQIVREESKCEL